MVETLDCITHEGCYTIYRNLFTYNHYAVAYEQWEV